MISNLKIIQTSANRKDVGELLKLSDDYMASLYPAESNHMDDTEELSKPNVFLVGAFEEGELVGIGAVKVLEDDVCYGEVKRLFIPTKHRGKGISKLIVRNLESHLVSQGVPFVRLEAGIKQPEALSLYTSLGYTKRDPFGNYPADPLCVFMEREISD